MTTEHQSTSPRDPSPQTYGKAVKVLLAVVFAAAITGYFSGLRQTSQQAPLARENQLREYRAAPPQSEPRQAEPEQAPRAVSYAELGEVDLGPNRNFRPSLEGLTPPQPLSPKEKRAPADEAEVREALAERAARRAFEGAPPTVPHPIAQIGNESCLSCHGEGKQMGETAAPKMCHQPLANCTQCHVEAKPGGGALGETLPNSLGENDFTGLEAPLAGPRAAPGAPPTIPHTTWMRQDCLSCHGPAGKNAIQTTHPWRTNCTQCHAPSAQLDQRPYLP